VGFLVTICGAYTGVVFASRFGVGGAEGRHSIIERVPGFGVAG
jgi:hypothetical protein